MVAFNYLIIVWDIFTCRQIFSYMQEKNVEGPVTLLPRPENAKPTGPVEYQS